VNRRILIVQVTQRPRLPLPLWFPGNRIVEERRVLARQAAITDSEAWMVSSALTHLGRRSRVTIEFYYGLPPEEQ